MAVKDILQAVLFRIVSLIIGLFILAVTLFKRWRAGDTYFKVKERPTEPAILSDTKWGNHNYIQLKGQGIKLHYVEKGDHTKPLIICVHGFPECWFSWRHQLNELSSKYWVVAVDMRGYGSSDKPPKKSDYALNVLIEDMREFIDVLRDGRKCTLLAHDWGGAIAWHLVLKYPHMFQRHISCNGPHFLAFRDVLHSNFGQMRKSWYIALFQNPWIPELMLNSEDLKSLELMFRGKNNNKDAFPDDVIEAYKYYYAKDDAWTPPLNYYRNIDLQLGGGEGEVMKVTVPSLIIWGKDDMALDQSIPVATTKYCEDIQLKFVDGASHWVQQEEPTHVNTLIHEYMAITS